jgi:hypothetical protein
LHFLVLYIKLGALNEETPLSKLFPVQSRLTIDGARAALAGGRLRRFALSLVAGPAMARICS